MVENIEALSDGTGLENGAVTSSKIASATVGNVNLASGVSVQIVSTNYSAFATGTTTIPPDNSIPQNTEGTEFMTQVITPKSATNTLIIETIMTCSVSAGSMIVQALFQDSVANALATSTVYQPTASQMMTFTCRHTMTAGTTSPITFKVRAGGVSASTFSFNGTGGSGYFGATTKSSIKVTEIKA